MIKASELMLGNWVYDGDKTKFPMQVVGIGENYVYLDFEDNEGGYLGVYSRGAARYTTNTRTIAQMWV